VKAMVAAGLLAMLAAAAAAQTANSPASFSPGRLSDGKTPDFRGIWQVRDTAFANIEGHAAEKGIAASKSLVVDPPDGKIPYKPDSLAKRQMNARARATADPSLKCYQAGVPRATYLATPLQILQSPGNFAIVYEEKPRVRMLAPGAHVIGNADPNDASVPKIARIARSAERIAAGPEAGALEALVDLCSSHEGGARALDHTCIHAGDYGTHSSTLLRRGARREADVLRFASGAPCAASYEDLTPLLRALD